MNNLNLKVKCNISSFKIELHKKDGLYYPGQEVTGYLIVHSETALSSTGIFLRFLGSSYASGSKNHTHNKENDYIHHYDNIKTKTEKCAKDINDSIKCIKNTEVYFDETQKLWGTGHVGEIDIGYHTLPFSLILPGKLPTSIETDRGYVRYTIIATIQNVKRKYDLRCQKVITVISAVDLNTIPNLEKFITKEENVQFGSTINKKGELCIKVTINKGGYTPGEKIIFNATSLNATKKSISHTTVSLICIISFQLDERIEQETKEVSKMEHQLVAPNDSDEWTNVQISIPSIPPSTFGARNLINLQYCILYTCCSSYGNIEVAIPIIIGTIPLQNNFSKFNSDAPSAQDSMNAPNSKQTYNKTEKLDGDLKKISSHDDEAYEERILQKFEHTYLLTSLHEAINLKINYESPPSYEESIQQVSHEETGIQVNKLQ